MHLKRIPRKVSLRRCGQHKHQHAPQTPKDQLKRDEFVITSCELQEAQDRGQRRGWETHDYCSHIEQVEHTHHQNSNLT